MINPAMTAPSGPRTTGPCGRLHATVARALACFELVPFGLLAHQTADYYQPDNAECGTSLFDGSETENPCTVRARRSLRCDHARHPPRLQRVSAPTDVRGPSVAFIEQFLCPRVLPVDRTLAEAGAGDLAAMLGLHGAVIDALAPGRKPTEESPTKAAAICARKRPELFPLLDRRFNSALGLPSPRDQLGCWRVLHAVSADDATANRLSMVFVRAAIEAGQQPPDIYPLRQLYVLFAHVLAA